MATKPKDSHLGSLKTIKEPCAMYCATGMKVCSACLFLDRRCYEKSEAERIEADLGCDCEHGWYGYPFLSKEVMDEHEIAKRELGLSRSLRPYPEQCPPELYALAIAYLKQDGAFLAEQLRVNTLHGFTPRNMPPDSVVRLPNVQYDDDAAYMAARRSSTRAKTDVNRYIKNYIRDRHGLPHVGKQWANETALFDIVHDLFPNDKVIHHYRADWLGRLELDVYVVGANIGFEYQGIQHFEPQKHWGGPDALARTKERDIEKARCCEEHGTCLIEVFYTEDVTEELVRKKLISKGYKA